MSEVASEIKWISSVLRDIGISLPVTPILYCDNLSVVYLTANPAFHSRTKHFEIDHHYVRERVALGALEVKHIPSHHQIADIFTNSLPQQSFCQLRFKLGVSEPPTPSLRRDIKTTKAKTLQQTEGLKKYASKTDSTTKAWVKKITSEDKMKGLQDQSSTVFNVQTKNRFDSLTAMDV